MYRVFIVIGLITVLISCNSNSTQKISNDSEVIVEIDGQWGDFNLGDSVRIKTPFNLTYSEQLSLIENGRTKNVFKGRDNDYNLRVIAKLNKYDYVVKTNYETLIDLVIKDIVTNSPNYKAIVDTVMIDSIESRVIKGETLVNNQRAFRYQAIVIKDSILLDVVFVFKTTDKIAIVDEIVDGIRL